MTGPEHYRKAERLLATAYEGTLTAYEGENPEADRAIAEAQVHATLALVAATAMQAGVDGSEPGMGSPEFEAWYQAAGVKPQPKGGDTR